MKGMLQWLESFFFIPHPSAFIPSFLAPELPNGSGEAAHVLLACIIVIEG